MRKYVFNISVLSAIAGVVTLVQETRRGPRDWRLGLMWVGWAVTVALAAGTVSRQADQQKKELD